MVIFIYEDPSDPSAKGVIKLKIAKHRNGPTGSVELFFRNQLAQFAPLAKREVNLS